MKKQHNNTRLICQLSAAAALVLSANAMAADAFSADSKWMTGDWGGTRTELLEKGYDFSLEYVANNGSSKTPALYNVATLWSALQGAQACVIQLHHGLFVGVLAD